MITYVNPLELKLGMNPIFGAAETRFLVGSHLCGNTTRRLKISCNVDTACLVLII